MEHVLYAVRILLIGLAPRVRLRLAVIRNATGARGMSRSLRAGLCPGSYSTLALPQRLLPQWMKTLSVLDFRNHLMEIILKYLQNQPSSEPYSYRYTRRRICGRIPLAAFFVPEKKCGDY